MPETIVRFADITEMRDVQRVFNKNNKAVGFVMLPTLVQRQESGQLYVAEQEHAIVGVVEWHLRRDHVCTLHTIAVLPANAGQGIGKLLLHALIAWARERNARLLRLKCPAGLPSNDFYRSQGLTHVTTEPGRKRALNIWEMPL